MADKLLQCPFCGGEASIYHGDDTDGYIKGTSYVMAFCGWCGARIRGKNEDEVIKKWNNHPSPWHTGTPTEDSRYLVQYENGEMEFIFFKAGKWLAKSPVESFYFIKNKLEDVSKIVVAWQKIEPYKEN